MKGREVKYHGVFEKENKVFCRLCKLYPQVSDPGSSFVLSNHIFLSGPPLHTSRWPNRTTMLKLSVELGNISKLEIFIPSEGLSLFPKKERVRNRIREKTSLSHKRL